MRVAWITTGFVENEQDYNGAAFLHNLAKELSLTGKIDLNIFALYYPIRNSDFSFYNANVFLCRDKGEKTTRVPKIEKLKAFMKCMQKFKKEHTRIKFDVIHSIWSGESGYIASLLSKKYDVPLATSIGGGELGEIPEIKYGSRLKFWQKKFVNRTFKQAKVIVTGSDYITYKIKQYFAYEFHVKTVKIPFGVDEKVFFPAQKSSDGTIKLINISTAFAVKAHIDLFKALKIVKEKYPNVLLECYGKNVDSSLQKIADEMDLKENVKLNGYIEYEKIPDALHQSDIFVLSSLYESQNMAVLEAAFCGLPVVSTDVGVAAEITPHIVKPHDYEGLAKKILYVMENPAVDYRNLSERFSLSSSVKGFARLYYSLKK
ncbi:MAG: glycosyltransferase family 4 protein [Chlorobi bacterium]|nr:glycosyltransferase family 4 protein [Chlorobiota bacterium]